MPHVCVWKCGILLLNVVVWLLSFIHIFSEDCEPSMTHTTLIRRHPPRSSIQRHHPAATLSNICSLTWPLRAPVTLSRFASGSASWVQLLQNWRWIARLPDPIRNRPENLMRHWPIQSHPNLLHTKRIRVDLERSRNFGGWVADWEHGISLPLRESERPDRELFPPSKTPASRNAPGLAGTVDPVHMVESILVGGMTLWSSEDNSMSSPRLRDRRRWETRHDGNLLNAFLTGPGLDASPTRHPLKPYLAFCPRFMAPCRLPTASGAPPLLPSWTWSPTPVSRLPGSWRLEGPIGELASNRPALLRNEAWHGRNHAVVVSLPTGVPLPCGNADCFVAFLFQPGQFCLQYLHLRLPIARNARRLECALGSGCCACSISNRWRRSFVSLSAAASAARSASNSWMRFSDLWEWTSDIRRPRRWLEVSWPEAQFPSSSAFKRLDSRPLALSHHL